MLVRSKNTSKSVIRDATEHGANGNDMAIGKVMVMAMVMAFLGGFRIATIVVRAVLPRAHVMSIHTVMSLEACLHIDVRLSGARTRTKI